MAQQRYCTANPRTRNFQLYTEPDANDAEFAFCGAAGQILPESPQWFHNTAFVDEVTTQAAPYGHSVLHPTCCQTTGHHYLLDLNVGQHVPSAVQPSAFQGHVPTVSLYHHYHHHHHHVTSYGNLDSEVKSEDQYRANAVDEYKPTLTQLTGRVSTNVRNAAPVNTSGVSMELLGNCPVNEDPFRSYLLSKRKYPSEKIAGKLIDVRSAAAAAAAALVTVPPKRRSVAATAAVKYQCFICGNNYCRQSTLKAHMRQHSGEKPYVCTTCGKNFTQSANLNAHQRVHTGEKPFSCPICCRPFSQSSSLMTHKRTHTGEKPYQCAMCIKSFTDSSTLTKHIRTHTLVKPYSCRICHFSFSQSGNLNRHMKTHMKKQE